MVQETTEGQYYYGTGKRKTAIAKVRLYLKGTGRSTTAGQVQVNGKPIEDYFPWSPWQDAVKDPLKVTDSVNRFNVVANVQGGGVAARSEAVRHGISRALVAYDDTFKQPLRRSGFITRDSRIKESKKYGLKRARRAPQYTKR